MYFKISHCKLSVSVLPELHPLHIFIQFRHELVHLQLVFLHLLRQVFLQGQLSLQFGQPAASDHLTKVLVLLVQLPTLGHKTLASRRVGGELPGAQLVLRLFGLFLQTVALLLQLLNDEVDGGIQQSRSQLEMKHGSNALLAKNENGSLSNQLSIDRCPCRYALAFAI